MVPSPILFFGPLYLRDADKALREKYGDHLPKLLDVRRSFKSLDPRIQKVLKDYFRVTLSKHKVLHRIKHGIL
jgi:hypothetical protein